MAASDDLRTLQTTADDATRNALALRLAEAGAQGLEPVLVALIQRPDLADKRGTLVHALGYLDCSDHLALLVELVASGNFEVAHEALQALETIDEADADDVEAAQGILDRARAVANVEPWREGLLDELAEMFD
jgi:hypothetical protein